MGLPINTPPVLIVQHMPEGFTQRFATRLNNECEVHIKEAAAGDVIRPGCVYIAPGHAHILIERVAGGSYKIVLSDGPEVNRHRPSVDVLFNSAAKVLGKNATSVLLTGMGRDGAQGMAAMKAAGAYCFAQDEASSVVYGMPRAAFELGVVDEQGSPEHLAVRVLDRLVALAQAQGSKA
jgi:two-component system chemotaxis response regulator CheB